MNLKILTFNWHEPYICLLSHLGHEIHVIEPVIPSTHAKREWDTNMRPLPDNCKLVTEGEAREFLEQGEYSLLIAHNVKDAVWAQPYTLPKIIVFHNKLSTEGGLSGNQVDLQDYRGQIKELTRNMKRVFISRTKQEDWGLDGEIIRPGIPLPEYGGYTGEVASVLRVGNMLKERDLMLGFTVGEEILVGFSSVTLGQNPTLPDSRLSRGFDDLREHYRSCRVFLNTTVDGYEDGYNLAMLEAMATGMPVISTLNQTSPIKDGVNGFIDSDVTVLRQRVAELLADPERARELGRNARETVEREFSLTTFVENWQRAAKEAILEFLERHKKQSQNEDSKPEEKDGLKILLDTNGNPVTTAQYMERALRREHEVVTCGSEFTQENINNWNMQALKWPINNPEITRNHGEPVCSVINQLPKGWKPDMYLFIETGLNLIPPDLAQLDIPKACYLIDTHLHLENHIEIGKHFDHVFIAQKEYIERFRQAGIEKVEWLPLACDPEVHGKQDVTKVHEVGFVGSILPTLPRRQQLLDALARRFKVHIDRKFMEDMTRVFCESKVVFNNAVRNDLNMRVFEAMCSGSLLVTDEVPGSGLEDLFQNGRHLVLYEDKNLVETVDYYLKHPGEAERIAEAGRQEVLANHTYDHRAQTLVSKVMGQIKEESKQDGKSGYFHNIRHDVISMVPEKAQCILEVGCGAGKTGEFLKRRNGAFVVGMELDEEAAAQAGKVLDEVIQGNIETMSLPYNPKSFDCILFADVLEHLADPLTVLKKIKPLLKDTGRVIASLPNVQFHGVVHQLAEGNWTYQDEGILDRTHLRFFTRKEMENLFREAGFDITAMEENLDGQFEKIKNSGMRQIKMGRVTITDLSEEEMRQFFVFQYRIAASPIGAAQGVDPTQVVSQADPKKEGLDKARNCQKSGEFSEALEIYQETCETDPTCVEAWVGQGNGRMRLNELDQARECYQKAIDLDSHSVGGHLGLGAISLQLGKLQESMEHYQKIIDENPSNDKALCGLGMGLEQNGDYHGARDRYIKALEYNLENAPAMASLLNISYKLGKFDDVERTLSQYLEMHPANIPMMFALAGVLFKSEKWDEAQKTLDSLLMFEPNHEDALELRKNIEFQTVESRP